MNIIIDTAKLSRRGLSINEYLALIKIYNILKGKDIVYTERKGDYISLADKGYVIIEDGNVILTNKALSLIQGRSRDYESLAVIIRELFPKGKKNNKWPWKSTIKSIVTKLKKLDNHYGMSEYSDDAVVNATKSYIGSFTLTDMDAGMSLANYFVEKDDNSLLMGILEDAEEPKSSPISNVKRL